MPLIVFDIDGTLTHTTGIDDSSFVKALNEVLGVPHFEPDWTQYPHATDSGLVLEVPRRLIGREPSEAEIARVKASFLAMIKGFADTPGVINQVPGAAKVIAELKSRGHTVAMATGAWKESARLKLTAAGMGYVIEGETKLPAAFADEAIDRRDIATLAMKRAGLHFPASGAPTGVIYVGDGVWDAKTSRAMGIGFVGVRVNGDFGRLQGEGAKSMVKDYTDLSRAVDLMERELREPVFGAAR